MRAKSRSSSKFVMCPRRCERCAAALAEGFVAGAEVPTRVLMRPVLVRVVKIALELLLPLPLLQGQGQGQGVAITAIVAALGTTGTKAADFAKAAFSVICCVILCWALRFIMFALV